jgi:hypothetical protein
MAATKDEANPASETKQPPSGKTTSTRGTKSAEPPREELTGVLRTSRVGEIRWRGVTSGSTPDELAERRHEKMDEAKKPGDEGYSPFKDPMVPSSTLAAVIAAELAGEDSEGSPTWDALNDAYQESYGEFTALKKYREERANRAS